MDKSRLATILFDSKRPLFESEYKTICNNIETDSLSFDEIVVEYKSKETILDSYLFVLNDGSRVLLSKELLEQINTLTTDKKQLAEFMGESRTNFSKALEAILDGNS